MILVFIIKNFSDSALRLRGIDLVNSHSQGIDSDFGEALCYGIGAVLGTVACPIDAVITAVNIVKDNYKRFKESQGKVAVQNI